MKKNRKIIIQNNIQERAILMKIITAFAIIMAIGLVAGCSETALLNSETAITEPVIQPVPTEIKEIHIDMFDWNFTQDKITIKKGDHVKLIVTSSVGDHGIAIPILGLSTKKILEGEQEILEFDATQAGTFEYYCNIPCGKGHKAMKSKIVVEE